MFMTNVLIWIAHTLHFFFRPFIMIMNLRKRPRIPPIKNPLLKISATELTRMIRNREISSQTIVEAYIQRIQEVNPYLNAVIEDRFEAAINDAKSCDEKLKSGEVTAAYLEKEKPLFGLPITVKESCSVAGMSFTVGTLPRRGMKATEDGEAVKILKNAGAILLCVTNVSEMCMAPHAGNYLFGSTRNPYDTRMSPGGSSGGEGALIGAGASILGFGSDLAGSLRIPGLFNGIFGHKPSSGVVPHEGHMPCMKDKTMQTIFSIGPMTRYAEDLPLAMKVLSVRSKVPLTLDKQVDVKSLRVFYVNRFESFCGVREPTADLIETINEAVRYFEEIGVTTQKLPQEWVRDTTSLYSAMTREMVYEEPFTDPHNPEKDVHPKLEILKGLLGLSKFTMDLIRFRLLILVHGFISLSKMERFRNTRLEISRKVNELLGEDGVFICPTFSQTTSYPGLIFFQLDSCMYTAFANIMLLPSTHIPMGLNSAGLPVGFQVIAAKNQDHLCFAVAQEFEKIFGGWVDPNAK
ncbi:fatty-acid amide hydrolase 2-A-like [Hylaeus volcanicus]|uniref:fatty-acid amide hydrolase 2-A-like n=1 Tax=Hylaeus volcanicus TaxID=313075 RepID=UPI0023B814EC|nr:fatty-acid amide hydrolase 2-A-like [Hylaeus volcanicus]